MAALAREIIVPENGQGCEGLSDYQSAFLRRYPCPQLFAIISWGCAATGWLATVLSRHPDIFCTHAANHAWHVLGECERLDGVRYLRVVGSQGLSRIAAGDVHGVSRHHVPELRRSFAGQFNSAVVVREPLARVQSHLGLFHQFDRRELWDIAYVNEIISRTGIMLPSDAYYWRFFVHAANMLNAILEEIEVGKVYRTEDLTRSAEALGDFIDEITRGKVNPSAEWLRLAVLTPIFNVHAERRNRTELDDWQVDVLRKVVHPRAWELYQELGYADVGFVS